MVENNNHLMGNGGDSVCGEEGFVYFVHQFEHMVKEGTHCKECLRIFLENNPSKGNSDNIKW